MVFVFGYIISESGKNMVNNRKEIMYMKRIQNRKETVRRERLIMVLSSVFVLAALVCVGIYMKGQNTQEQDDGYEIDFAKLETNVTEKYDELAAGIQEQADSLSADDALDYMPMEGVLEEGIYMEEAGSGQVEIGKKQDQTSTGSVIKEAAEEELLEEVQAQEELLEQEVIQEKGPSFTEAEGFYLPVAGEVLMHYDMEHTVYFATLDQYKYNPATIISAEENTPVYACADGIVTGIYSNEELGFAMTIDLGNGYEVTYGQVKDFLYKEGDRVARGNQIATVAAPTKYYSVEGSNLYFSLKQNGEIRSAEGLLPLE